MATLAEKADSYGLYVQELKVMSQEMLASGEYLRYDFLCCVVLGVHD